MAERNGDLAQGTLVARARVAVSAKAASLSRLRAYVPADTLIVLASAS